MDAAFSICFGMMCGGLMWLWLAQPLRVAPRAADIRLAPDSGSVALVLPADPISITGTSTTPTFARIGIGTAGEILRSGQTTGYLSATYQIGTTSNHAIEFASVPSTITCVTVTTPK